MGAFLSVKELAALRAGRGRCAYLGSTSGAVEDHFQAAGRTAGILFRKGVTALWAQRLATRRTASFAQVHTGLASWAVFAEIEPALGATFQLWGQLRATGGANQGQLRSAVGAEDGVFVHGCATGRAERLATGHALGGAQPHLNLASGARPCDVQSTVRTVGLVFL